MNDDGYDEGGDTTSEYSGVEDAKADVWLAAFNAKLGDGASAEAALAFAIKAIGCYNAYKNIVVNIETISTNNR